MKAASAAIVIVCALAGPFGSRCLTAAPTITDGNAFKEPARAATGEPILIYASGLIAPVRVFFSDGANPTVEATPVLADITRGVVLAKVPAGAATGSMKISAAGVDSPLYYFRTNPTGFVTGTDTVTGHVTSGGSPVPGALLVLLRDTGCQNPQFQDFAVTDSAGSYTVHGVDGNYLIYVVPPLPSGLAVASAKASLSPTPATLEVPLAAGTSVTGTVVDEVTSAAVPGARVTFDGPSHEEILTDGSGGFAVRLPSGSWKYTIRPPSCDGHTWGRATVSIGGISQSLGILPLAIGVSISGRLTRASDGSPLAGGRVDALDPSGCCVDVDNKMAAGDGSYCLVVPQNHCYNLGGLFDSQSDIADAPKPNFCVGTGNVTLDITAVDAAFITGTATQAAPGTGPINCLRISAQQMGPMPSGGATETCADGTYRLRVAPGTAGNIVSTAENDCGGPEYAAEAWKVGGGATFFLCEGDLVPAPTAGGTTPGINFAPPLAAEITGKIASQATGCTDDLGNLPVTVDDGSPHVCGMGLQDFNQSPPGYAMGLLPPSSVVPSLRACASVAGFSGQCYNMKTPPTYDPIVVAPGGTAPGINFCLAGCTPSLWHPDLDGDGFGNPNASVQACVQPPGYVADGTDCNDSDPLDWATPSQARSLLFNDSGDLAWSAPAFPGAAGDLYDLLRSNTPADFVSAATCVASGTSGTTAADTTVPVAGSTFYYLVRADDHCPSGLGPLGFSSNGTLTPGRTCP